MSFVVVDASLWVSRLVTQDVFHSMVKDWFQRRIMTGDVLLSPSLLLAEVAGAVSRRTGDSHLAGQAIARLQNLPGFRLVAMENRLVDEAAHLAAELGLRGADSIYVALAASLAIPMVTLDEDQRQRASERVVMIDIEGT